MGYKAKVDLICKAEAIILNDPYNFLSQEINHQWLKMLPKWPICVKLRSCFYKITEATQILLFFDNGLPKNQFSIKPNKSGCLKNFKVSSSYTIDCTIINHIIYKYISRDISISIFHIFRGMNLWNK